jgi:hypothetical protein
VTALADEQERTHVGADGKIAQVAKYIHGVGDSSNLLFKVLGGTLGFGIIARIVRGYTFISRSSRLRSGTRSARSASSITPAITDTTFSASPTSR